MISGVAMHYAPRNTRLAVFPWALSVVVAVVAYAPYWQ
jgi:hypothetical protein